MSRYAEFRVRAEQARSLAERVSNAGSRQSLIQAADSWETLARLEADAARVRPVALKPRKLRIERGAAATADAPLSGTRQAPG